jgi:hypothetical protein
MRPITHTRFPTFVDNTDLSPRRTQAREFISMKSDERGEIGKGGKGMYDGMQ